MKIDEMINVLQAFKAGEKIEKKLVINGTGAFDEWLDMVYLNNFDFINFNYRIKPKAEDSKYIPYTIEDIKEFIDEVVVTKRPDGDIFRKINKADSNSVFLTEFDGTAYPFEYETLMKHHFKIDGTPFGKLNDN
jgi:hypothetical protein